MPTNLGSGRSGREVRTRNLGMNPWAVENLAHPDDSGAHEEVADRSKRPATPKCCGQEAAEALADVLAELVEPLDEEAPLDEDEVPLDDEESLEEPLLELLLLESLLDPEELELDEVDRLSVR